MKRTITSEIQGGRKPTHIATKRVEPDVWQILGVGLLKLLLGFFFLLLISRVGSHLEDICFKVNSDIFFVKPSLSLSKQSETLSFHLISLICLFP